MWVFVLLLYFGTILGTDSLRAEGFSPMGDKVIVHHQSTSLSHNALVLCNAALQKCQKVSQTSYFANANKQRPKKETQVGFLKKVYPSSLVFCL